MLTRLATGRFPVPVGFQEAVGTEAGDVGGRCGLEHRFHHVSADAGRSVNPMGVAATGHHETGQAATLSDQEAAIGREGRPTPEHAADSQVADGWQVGCQLSSKLSQYVPVGLDARIHEMLQMEVSRGFCPFVYWYVPPFRDHFVLNGYGP